MTRLWSSLVAANAALERFERDHPVWFALVAIPVCAVGVMLVAWLPLVWEVMK